MSEPTPVVEKPEEKLVVEKPEEKPVVEKSEEKSEVQEQVEQSEQQEQQNEDAEAAADEGSEEDQIVKQVEFYFSDSNLPNDKFLWRLVQSNAPEGYVPISTIAQFTRMRKFRPLQKIVDALKHSDFLDVSENNELVKRKNPLIPLSEDERKNAFQRSIYAKGFPLDNDTPEFQIELETFFNQFGKTNQVRMRRNYRTDKKFKGSVFVEFSTFEEAEGFLKLDPKPTYKGQELAIMSKAAYVEMKDAEHQFKNSYSRRGGAPRGRGGRGNFRGGRGGRGRGRGRGGSRGGDRGSKDGVNKN